uniref:Uncharacterized protein n=1 Tax=Aegilops tauschii subsp. strangulata TaxID=200361 RepID=A0A453NEI2_AEGTS
MRSCWSLHGTASVHGGLVLINCALYACCFWVLMFSSYCDGYVWIALLSNNFSAHS